MQAPEGSKDYVFDPEEIDMKNWGGEARIQSQLPQWVRRFMILEQLRKLVEEYK